MSLLGYHDEEELAAKYYSQLANPKKGVTFTDMESVPIADVEEDLKATRPFNPKQSKDRLQLLGKITPADKTYIKMPRSLKLLIQRRQRGRVRFIDLLPSEGSKAYRSLIKEIDSERALDTVFDVAHAYHTYLGKQANQTVVDNRKTSGQELGPYYLSGSKMLVFVVPVIQQSKDRSPRLYLDETRLETVMDEHKEHIQKYLNGDSQVYQLSDKDGAYELLAMCLQSSSIPCMLLGVNMVASNKWKYPPTSSSAVATSCKLLDDRKMPLRVLYTSTDFKFSNGPPPYEPRNAVLSIPFNPGSTKITGEGSKAERTINTATFGVIDQSSSTFAGCLREYKSDDFGYGYSSNSPNYGNKYHGGKQYQHQHKNKGDKCPNCDPDSYFLCRYCSDGT